ncbi:EmrB/QacA subfamily drug resistance transporter [Melghirimyces profundicolus]|uniref:EmrB/QacA subfamily drug resistance transporter n=1 Tax=Melghirimyces profundicolus TaxID=1242148 RepID=A0A2T6BQI4_9BACL|nr:MDR family MFS transporter [Melghirimyces profundicolus]PTX58351.1 EmrB/QacA subfamily drug resistance transporter [Melghirimyces profundicolus]
MTEMNRSRRNIITGALMAAMFIAAVEVTVVNAAMPTVVGALGGISLYSWVFSAFMLANTLTVPIYGKLADLHGRKKVFITAVLLFVGGSALCGFSQSMGQLVFFRAIQGLGAGGVLPVAVTIVGDLFPFELRARVQGWFSSMWGLAAIVGPFIGGWTVDHLSWRWIFWFNLPLGTLIVLTVAFFLHERVEEEKKRIDYTGAVLFTLSVLGILSFTQLVGNRGTDQPLAWGLLAGGSALLVVFLLWERRVESPFIPLGLFRNRMIASSNLTAFLTGMGMFGAISFVPLFVQGVLDQSPTLAGLAITPQVLGWSTSAVVAGRWLLRQGYRPPIVTGAALVTLSAAGFTFMDRTTPYALVLAGMFLLGCGLGLSMTAFIVAVQNAVHGKDRGAATSSQMFSRSMGGAFGVTLLGTVMSFRLKDQIGAYIARHQSELSGETIRQLERARGVTSPEGFSSLPTGIAEQMSRFLSQALDTTFLTAFLFSVAALAAAFLLVPKGSARSLSVKD